MTASDYILQLVPYIVIATIVCIVVLFWTIARGKKIKKTRLGELSMLTVEGMMKKGLLTKEEYERVRKRTAERELERIKASGGAGASGAELLVMQEALANPEAVTKLLTPEEQAIFEERKRQSQAAAAARQGPTASQILTGTPLASAAAAPTSVPPQAEPQWDQDFITDPLAMPPVAPKPALKPAPQPPQPSMNMTNVVRANQEAEQAKAQSPAGAETPGELELLLAKGAISQEEYARLKQFFK